MGQPWISDVSLTAATLSWYGPAYDGGCPITNYRVEKCDAEENDWHEVTRDCKVRFQILQVVEVKGGGAGRELKVCEGLGRLNSFCDEIR